MSPLNQYDNGVTLAKYGLVETVSFVTPSMKVYWNDDFSNKEIFRYAFAKKLSFENGTHINFFKGLEVTFGRKPVLE